MAYNLTMKNENWFYDLNSHPVYTYCDGTYLPNYNDSTVDWTNKDVISEREGSFWCPIVEKTLNK